MHSSLNVDFGFFAVPRSARHFLYRGRDANAPSKALRRTRVRPWFAWYLTAFFLGAHAASTASKSPSLFGLGGCGHVVLRSRRRNEMQLQFGVEGVSRRDEHALSDRRSVCTFGRRRSWSPEVHPQEYASGAAAATVASRRGPVAAQPSAAWPVGFPRCPCAGPVADVTPELA